MIDPISIVGLTIAIFDQLLKLGERSAELTSDIRGFSDVCCRHIMVVETRFRVTILRDLRFFMRKLIQNVPGYETPSRKN